MNGWEIRRKLREYFGKTQYKAELQRYRGKRYVYVEYTDFKPEPAVEAELRMALGENVSISIKREVSERMKKRIDDWVIHKAGTREFFAFIYAYLPITC